MLGISEGADKKEVETAFKRCIASGHSVKEATWARNILNNPVERSFYDLFRYDENFLSQLRPRLTVDMLLQKRKQIAESWSIIQKKLFPHIPSTHSLAVLWYWWSLYREEELLASVMQTPFNRKQVQSLSASSENPFYFKKDNKILVASNNVDELIWAIDRLKRENPDIVAYHLKEGHIVLPWSYAKSWKIILLTYSVVIEKDTEILVISQIAKDVKITNFYSILKIKQQN
jgi:hypothetical protein